MIIRYGWLRIFIITFIVLSVVLSEEDDTHLDVEQPHAINTFSETKHTPDTSTLPEQIEKVLDPEPHLLSTLQTQNNEVLENTPPDAGAGQKAEEAVYNTNTNREAGKTDDELIAELLAEEQGAEEQGADVVEESEMYSEDDDEGLDDEGFDDELEPLPEADVTDDVPPVTDDVPPVDIPPKDVHQDNLRPLSPEELTKLQQEETSSIKPSDYNTFNPFDEIEEVPPPIVDNQEQAGTADLVEAQKILGLRASGKESSQIVVSKPNYRKAYSLLEQSASAGNAEAAVLLGHAHLTGEHVPFVAHNTTKAFELFTDASVSGLPSAQYAVGMMYATGIETESSQSKALLYYTFAALGGDPQAQMALGFRYWSGISVAQSCESALKYYTLVADNVARKVGTIGTGQIVLRIRLMEEELSPQNSPLLDEDLVQYYQFLADKGDLQAQLGLGQLYLSGGRGIERSIKLAQHYFNLAAKSGNSNAYGYLGKIAIANKEYDISLKYFKLAAKDPLGQWGIGTLFYNGWGVQQDYKQALAYFTSAAAQGHTEAELQLGLMYLSGVGVPKDYGVALKHFNLASKAGHVLAFYNLGMMHAGGVGVMRNCQTAAELLKNVAERGTWSNDLMDAHALYHKGFIDFALIRYVALAEQGYEVAQTNAAYILDKEDTEFITSLNYRYNRAFVNWRRAATQGFGGARLKLGDYYYYGKGTEVNSEEAAEQYQLASDLDKNPQAMFNLGYMHELGIGRQQDNHLAKRFYDLAATTSQDAQIPATLANTRLQTKILADWVLRGYQEWEWLTLVDCVWSWCTGSLSLFYSTFNFTSKLFTEMEETGGQDWDIYLMSILAVLLGVVMAVRGNHIRAAQLRQQQQQQPQPAPAPQ